ncbi:hypothetical protein [Thermococcus sp.]|uniref:hypothetical protein n=1 Tax=Thermococcus sp. TaxID=35749 RepID=UPI0026126DA3|nr:hypothetical protein [Thermococcus sp.]
MRRLYWAVPFLAYPLAYLFWEFRPALAFFVALNWLVFLMEYRYGGESKESEELTVFGVSMALLLLPVGGYITVFAEVFTAFMFIFEFLIVLLKAKKL